MSKRAIVLNEAFEPVVATDVEMFDADTGDILETAPTDLRGIAIFDGAGAATTLRFRPRSTRHSGRSGNMPLTGVLRVWQIADGS